MRFIMVFIIPYQPNNSNVEMVIVDYLLDFEHAHSLHISSKALTFVAVDIQTKNTDFRTDSEHYSAKKVCQKAYDKVTVPLMRRVRAFHSTAANGIGLLCALRTLPPLKMPQSLKLAAVPSSIRRFRSACCLVLWLRLKSPWNLNGVRLFRKIPFAYPSGTRKSDPHSKLVYHSVLTPSRDCTA